MTTEEDFQAALDAAPEDWQTRLVLVDWLEERNDPRAEGYRVLGMNGIYPYPKRLGSSCPWYSDTRRFRDPSPHYRIPDDWFDLIELDGKKSGYAPDHSNRTDATRRELEDAAALAFAKLPAARREELLTPVLT